MCSTNSQQSFGPLSKAKGTRCVREHGTNVVTDCWVLPATFHVHHPHLIQISDLQRLLEMFARWQQRIFPHCEFDDFVGRLEKLSSSYILKASALAWLLGVLHIHAHFSFFVLRVLWQK
jgi:hypothetical protein